MSLKYVTNIRELAVMLECSQKTLSNYSKQHGCPGKEEKGYDVAKWKKFYKLNRKSDGRPQSKPADKSKPDEVDAIVKQTAETKLQKLKEETDSAKIKNAQQLGQLVDIGFVHEFLNELGVEWRKVIESSKLDKSEKKQLYTHLQHISDSVSEKHERAVQRSIQNT